MNCTGCCIVADGNLLNSPDPRLLVVRLGVIEDEEAKPILDYLQLRPGVDANAVSVNVSQAEASAIPRAVLTVMTVRRGQICLAGVYLSALSLRSLIGEMTEALTKLESNEDFGFCMKNEFERKSFVKGGQA